MRKPLLFALFSSLLLAYPLTPVSGFQTNLFPLKELQDGSFKMISYPFPKCGEALFLGQFPWIAWVNEDHAVLVTGRFLVNCQVPHNLSSKPRKIEITLHLMNGSVVKTMGTLFGIRKLKLHLFKAQKNTTTTAFMKVEVYNVTLWNDFKGRKVTYTVVNVTLMYPDQMYRPVELLTLNATLAYLPYNSTHELVVLNFTNLKMGADSPYIWNDYAGGGANPEHSPLVSPALFGWPVNMTIKILVNKETGEGYLLDGERKVYLGVTPFWYPGVIPSNFVGMVLRNTKKLINDVKANPWVVEQVLEKARLANGTSQAAELINSLALKLSSEITATRFRYLGRTVYLVATYSYNLTGLSFPPYINGTLKGSYYLPTFMLPQNGTYLIYSEYVGYVGTNVNVSRVLGEFAKTGNLSLVEGLINSSIYLSFGYLPAIAMGWGKWIVSMDSTLPIDINKTELFVVPLPEKYARVFNASYLMVETGTRNRFHVRYDPSFFTPASVIYNFSRVGQCEVMLNNALVNRFLSILNSQKVNGFNVSAFEKIYPFVLNELKGCGFNVTSTQNINWKSSSKPSETSEIQRTEKSSSPVKTSSSKSTGRSICGPASVLVLALLPLVRRRQRK